MKHTLNFSQKFIILFLIMLFLSLSIVAYGIRERKENVGELISLKKAYEDKLITREDLLNIAYYFNKEIPEEGFVPKAKEPQEMSLSIKKKILELDGYEIAPNPYPHVQDKKLVLKYIGDDGSEGVRFYDTVEEVYSDFIYYGTYNGCVACYFLGKLEIVMTMQQTDIIDGVPFKYNSVTGITIWHSN